MNRVCVFGGTGFLGRRIVAALMRAGLDVRIAVRRPRRGRETFPAALAAADFLEADICDKSDVERALSGCDAAVNAVSLYVEKGGRSYEDVHVKGAALLAGAARRQDASRLVHVSGIGADPDSDSSYIAARGRGEEAVWSRFPGAAVLRPSVLFGPEDSFLNSFAGLITRLPVLPLIGGGRTRLQPVHAADVAEAAATLLDPGTKPRRLFELGGPEILSLRAICERLAGALDRRPRFVTIPFSAARPAARLAEFLPGAPLTRAQVDLLAKDNLAAPGTPGFENLGIAPRALDETVARIAKDRR